MNENANAAEPNRIESLHVQGFRSLADVKLESVPNPMVLLGANGAGKSNVLRFLQLLKQMSRLRLEEFVQRHGGADDQLFGGRRRTLSVEAVVELRSGQDHYRVSFDLRCCHPDRLVVGQELVEHVGNRDRQLFRTQVGESTFMEHARSPAAPEWQKAAADVLGDSTLYQFHDTSDASPLKVRWDAEDNHRLLEHGGNLAPMLVHLRENKRSRYDLVCRQIPRVLPDFNGFELDVDYGKTMLRWRSKTTGKTMGAHLTSDGALRALCLITLLSLPDELLPRLILLDEPELGLHPAAISLISHMVKSLARRRQVIVATQSPYFVDAFDLEEVYILNLREGRTEAHLVDSNRFGHLLKHHSTGELWWKGVLGG